MPAAVRTLWANDRRHPWRSLVLALLIYAAIAIPAGIERCWVLNPDGVSYIRLATHLAEGRFSDSVSGYWNPLMIWLMAPLRYWSMDGQAAGRLVIGCFGGVFVVAAWIFLRRFARLRWRWEALILILVAMTTAVWTTGFICPDMLLAATLLAYIASALSPRLLERPSTPFCTGLLGGVAYLAKAYGLPYFLAHFTFTLVLMWYLRRATVTWKMVLRAGAIGLLGFFLVAGPWIAVLSNHYGKLTFSTTARIAHTVVGPPGAIRAHPLHLLYHVPPGRLSTWEVPECMEYHPWSPFESWDKFKYQLAQMKRTRVRIFEDTRGFDVMGLSLAGFILFPLAAWAARRRIYAGRYVWLFGTISIYLGGFLPVYYSDRYLMPLIWSLFCIQFFVAWRLLGRQLWRMRRGPTVRYRWTWGLLTAVCVWSFASIPFAQSRNAVFPAVSRSQTPWSPRIGGAEMRRLGCRGPVAVTSRSNWTIGLYLSYFLDEPFAGVATAKTVEEVQRKLDEFGIQTFVIAHSWRHAKAWRSGKVVPWKEVYRIPIRSAPLFVFVREPADKKSESSSPG